MLSEVSTVALAAGLVAAVLALGVAVVAGAAAVRAGVGVVVELLLPPHRCANRQS
jgi:hypothetical protein